VLLVLAHSARKQHHEARQLLLSLLASAVGEGYMRLFLDEGAALAALLRASLPAIREPALAAYLQTLLHAWAAEHPAPNTQPGEPKRAASLAEPLSPQEQRVLHLLVAGCSNPEIAAQLIVSVNTVKAHLKNIYRKLGVRNRLEAARQARNDA
jgi:LuxR family maltose regulon positive regulatory protein